MQNLGGQEYVPYIYVVRHPLVENFFYIDARGKCMRGIIAVGLSLFWVILNHQRVIKRVVVSVVANNVWSGRVRSGLFQVLVNLKVISQPARRSSKR